MKLKFGTKLGQVANETGRLVAEFYGLDADTPARRLIDCYNECLGVSSYGLASGALADAVQFLREIASGHLSPHAEPGYIAERAATLIQMIDGI